eukprot:6186084-Pleurochrysis_carterae.AAC.2
MASHSLGRRHADGYAMYIRCLQRNQCCVVRHADVCCVAAHCGGRSMQSARDCEWRSAQTRASFALVAETAYSSRE